MLSQRAALSEHDILRTAHAYPRLRRVKACHPAAEHEENVFILPGDRHEKYTHSRRRIGIRAPGIQRSGKMRSPFGRLQHPLLTDSSPDLTDIDSYLRSITSQYATPQEQAIAIWRWSQRLRKQTTNPKEDGHEILDPIQFFNSYGYCNCGIVSGVNNALWLKMGWKAHYVQLGDHTVCECSWDGGKTWHMFDASMSFYCFNEKGEVASVREIENNPRFYLETSPPSAARIRSRASTTTAAGGAPRTCPCNTSGRWPTASIRSRRPNSVTDGNLYAQWGRRYVLNLRPGEHYTRYFRPLDGGGPGTFRPVRGNQDVDTQQIRPRQRRVALRSPICATRPRATSSTPTRA